MRDSYTSKADIRREKEREKERAKLERSGCGSGHDYVEVSSRCFDRTESNGFLSFNSPSSDDSPANDYTPDWKNTRYQETTYKCTRCGDRETIQKKDFLINLSNISHICKFFYGTLKYPQTSPDV